ncbi:kinase-like protein [Aspergillus bertholletiae]|uniref:Kinase-like protein n=1 Tax=Aspergillus bertholletiae TaxID=1226010 RepID=A0A5N7AS62_9EURO|nr:kinase-like protein [Aspergillus bertholletiae]
MTDSTGGVPFQIQNLQQGNRYIKIGTTLFPCPFANLSDFPPDLPQDQEIITVLSKQRGRLVLEHDFSHVTKSGHGVRPSEAEAMRLASKHTSAPVPEVIFADFGPDYGNIVMTLIPGSRLGETWDTLDEKSKGSICLQVWDIISKIRTIPRPSELQCLFQCVADGSLTQDPLLEDLKDPARPLISDSDLRARILARYFHFGGRQYEHQLPEMLPRSDMTVFTYADIAPRNIMIDQQNNVTGILGWEWAGILRPAFWGDWSIWMDRTAPQRWDISGINAARKILF